MLHDSKTGAENVLPYRDNESKGAQVEEMFDSIAPAYDFMNTAMTFGLHRRWRDIALDMALKALNEEPKSHSLEILDVATGTGDVAFALASRIKNCHITGIDLSEGMLNIARKKRANSNSETANRLSFEEGDCLNLHFPDNSFSLVTVAYGVRNFEHLLAGLKEMNRVLMPGGVLAILELSRPKSLIPRLGYDIYSRMIIPSLGKIVSGDKSAYSYLLKSIAACPQRNEMTDLMSQAGFVDCNFKSLTLGAVTIYIGKSPSHKK